MNKLHTTIGAAAIFGALVFAPLAFAEDTTTTGPKPFPPTGIHPIKPLPIERPNLVGTPTDDSNSDEQTPPPKPPLPMVKNMRDALDGKPPRLASTTPPGMMRDEMRDRMGSTTGDRMKEIMKLKAEDRVKESIKRTTTLVIANADRLEKLIQRVISRADKLDALGVDTAGARSDLDAAQAEIDAAKSDITSITPTALRIMSSPTIATVSEAVTGSRAAFKSANDHLKAARDYIMSAVKKLGDAAKAKGIGEPHASSTEQHN